MSKTKWKFTDMARRYARAHLPARFWTDRDIKALADMLGIVRMRAYGDGFNEGYAACLAETERKQKLKPLPPSDVCPECTLGVVHPDGRIEGRIPLTFKTNLGNGGYGT